MAKEFVEAEAGVANGTVDPKQIAMIAKLKAEKHMSIEDAIIKVHEQEQQAQAQAQQAPEEPEAQPGLGSAAENQATMQPAPAIAAPPQAQSNLSQLMSSLGGGSRIPQAEVTGA